MSRAYQKFPQTLSSSGWRVNDEIVIMKLSEVRKKAERPKIDRDIKSGFHPLC